MFDTKKKVKFNVQFRTTKLSFFTSNKDKIPFLNNSYVVYASGLHLKPTGTIALANNFLKCLKF